MRDPAGRRSRRADARPAGSLPARAADRRRREVRGARRDSRRLRRGAATGARPAARCARHRVPAAGLAGVARDSPRARPRVIPKSRGASVRRNRCARLRRPAPPMRWRSRFPAIASCATTAACRVIAGASSASVRCSTARRARTKRRRMNAADEGGAIVNRRARGCAPAAMRRSRPGRSSRGWTRSISARTGS